MDTYFSQAKIFSGEKTTNFPIGRGYLVSRKLARLVQVATYGPEGCDYEEAIKEKVASIRKKYIANHGGR